MIEHTQPPLVIMTRIDELIQTAQNNYKKARNTKEWKYYEGRWSALIDAYKIAVEVLAEVEREMQKETGDEQ